MKLVISYIQLQTIIDSISEKRLQINLIDSYAKDIVKRELKICLYLREVKEIKDHLLTTKKSSLYETIFEPHLIITEDNVKKYYKDSAYVVDKEGNVVKIIITSSEMYKELNWKIYDSEEKVKEKAKEIKWIPNHLYWVKSAYTLDKGYRLRYSAHEIGYFVINQNTCGQLAKYLKYQIADSNIKLPIF